MDPQLIERSIDLIEDMIEGRAAGDHGFTGGARQAWRRQKRSFYWFARSLITGASTQFVIDRGVKFIRAECPVSAAMRSKVPAIAKQRGTKGGRRWVQDAHVLISDVRTELYRSLGLR
jgi:hypothetical protein